MALLVLACCEPASAQVRNRREGAVLSAAYFATFSELHSGEYKDALRGFRDAGRGAIRTIDTRWIDSICYHTMNGEVHFRMGQLQQALGHYDSALRLYVQYPDWMLRVEFPDAIAPVIATQTHPTWGKSKRRIRLGRYPETFNIVRGGNRVVQVNGKSVITRQNQLHPLHVDELVRCITLSISRRRELLGPYCKHDKLTTEVLGKLSSRQGPPNHWSECYIDLPLGMAYAAADKPQMAVAALKRSMLAGGEFDYPLTCVAQLELGRLAFEQGDYKSAAAYFEEASYSAFYYDRPEVIEEALRMGHLVHAVTGGRGVYTPLARASVWANSKRLREMHVALLIAAAEDYVVMDDVKRTQAMLSQVSRALGRREMIDGAIGARFFYVTAMAQYARGNEKAAGEALHAALKYQIENKGSIKLFQIAAIDAAYKEGYVRERLAIELYEKTVGGPYPIDWRHGPMEALSLLMADHETALDNWFNVAMAREDYAAALTVSDRMRRARFLRRLPLGGRLLNLQWVLQAPTVALSQAALLQRNDLVGRYPRIALLGRESTELVEQMRETPLDAGEDREVSQRQARLFDLMENNAKAQDATLHKIALRREPVEIVFPPLHEAADLQKKLAKGQAILVFHTTKRQQYGFLVTGQRIGHWPINSPAKVKENLTTLLRTMGHYDQGRELSTDELASSDWREPAAALLEEIMKDARIDLGQGIEDLVIVPDGLMWYVPFEMLPLEKGPEGDLLLTRTRVRYAPTLSLAFPDGRGRRRGPVAVVQGRLYPREDETLGTEVVRQIRKAIPHAQTIKSALLGPSRSASLLMDGLVVHDDLEPNEKDPLGLAPLQVDRGKEGSTLRDWMDAPWGAPDLVMLPGFHTPAENSLKRLNSDQRPGDEMFQTTMGLLASGTRTVMLSRWRNGGQTAIQLMREFVQELPNTTAQDAWQRSVQLAHEWPIDAESEPRVKAGDSGGDATAAHPFMWSGYMVIDPGDDPRAPEKEAGPPKLKFPGK